MEAETGVALLSITFTRGKITRGNVSLHKEINPILCMSMPLYEVAVMQAVILRHMVRRTTDSSDKMPYV